MGGITRTVSKPKKRSALRLRLGSIYFGWRRRLQWLNLRKNFAAEQSAALLPYVSASHQTPLLRKLKNLDMQLQYNKITNLRLAAARLDGLLLPPGKIFSYWRSIGNPTRRKGYLPGMVLRNGAVAAGVGGGLCQLSNLIFWMALHTPLTILERHRHSYDVFPDDNRTQPFGSGATCYYPHVDLMLQNNTQQTYQLHVWLTGEQLMGEWRVSNPPEHEYKIVEKNHFISGAYWGGYIRHNELYRQVFEKNVILNETMAVTNDALLLYSPLLEGDKCN